MLVIEVLRLVVSGLPQWLRVNLRDEVGDDVHCGEAAHVPTHCLHKVEDEQRDGLAVGTAFLSAQAFSAWFGGGRTLQARRHSMLVCRAARPIRSPL